MAVLSDGAGVAEALVVRLGRAGIEARVVREVTVGDSFPAVIALTGLRSSGPLDALKEAFAAGRAIAPVASERGGVFVTVQDTGGDFGLSGSERAMFGGLAGLAKTASLEWPRAAVKAIDLERGDRSADALADAIVQELLAGGAEVEVGLHADGRRTTLRSVLSPLPAATELPLDGDSVVVCSGGARGVTAATMIALAERTGAKMVLLGRTKLGDEPPACRGADDEPSVRRALMMAAKASGEKVAPAAIGKQAKAILAQREIRATLAALEAKGSPARYVSVDVTDGAAVSAALDAVRSEWGAIGALVHGAGVVADKLIADKTDDAFEWVVSTKIAGMRALLDATASDPLKVIAFFSSVAARTGNVGQCDYAAANEILNKVAAHESARRPGCTVTSLGWGPWEAGMVTPSLKRYFEEHGVALIPLEVGGRMLVDELGASRDARGSVEVVLGGTPRRASIADAAEEGSETLRFDLRLHADTHPYLADHSIDGTVVLPVVMVLEYFARAAEQLRPELMVEAVRDVKVLRGVPLPEFAGAGDWVRIVARAIDAHDAGRPSVEVALCDVDDERKRRYAAVVDLCAPTELNAPPADAEAPRAYAPLDGELYGTSLFHGPAFQVIRDLDGVADDGIAGTLVGVVDQRWPGRFRTDPALFDGGLQLAVRWAEQRLGGRGLPTSVGALRLFTEQPVAGALRTLATITADGPTKAVSDIAFIDPEGRLVARLEGVETHQRP
ncbi:MAG TPA: SDR family NAD(P)-dependent oxidoreductase [Polyangiaceae bacterium]|nr:SDR family NAD(P)-dependent oxidoreductase [Polyangiaceae bacterium]